MKIPNKITIGQKEYRVKLKSFIDLFHWNISGNINYFDAVLQIKQNKDKRVEEEVFFHELAHGILKELEYNHPSLLKFRNDEQFVQELGLLMRKSFLDLADKQKEIR